MASSSSTTTSAKSTAWRASATAIFSSFSTTRAFLRIAGGVDQANGAVVAGLGIDPLPIDRDCIAGDARFGAGEEAVLAEQGVDQRGLARVGATDDGEFERARGIVFIGVVGMDWLVEALVLFAFEIGQQRFEQVAHAFAVFGRQPDRVAEAQREALIEPAVAGLALGLVGDEDHRHGAAMEPAADFLVQRRDPGAGIDHEQREVGALQRDFGLHPHPAGQAFGVLVFPAGGIDDW